MQRGLKHAEDLEQDDPEEEGEAGQGRRYDNGIAGQFRVAAELLGHGEGRDGAGRGEDADERDEFDAPDADQHGQGKDDAGHHEQAARDDDGEVADIVPQRADLERGAQDQEGHRRGAVGQLGNGFLNEIGDADAREQEEEAEDGTDDHGVLQYVEQGRFKGKSAVAPEGFQDEDAHDVEDGDHDGDHHGRHGEGFAAEDVLHHGDAEQDEVAAVDGLDHGAAGLVVRRQAHREDGGYGDDGEDGSHGEQDQLRAYGLVQRRDVQVVEHHAEKEDFEDHAVHVPDFRVREQFAPADVGACQDQQKQRHDGLDGHKKILFHDFTRFCF